MRKIWFKKDSGEIVIRSYRVVPKRKELDIYIEDDNLCDECEFKYDCPVARVLRSRRCF